MKEVFDFKYSSQAYLRIDKRVGPAFIVMRILYSFREIYNRNPSPKTRDEDIKQLEIIRNQFSNEFLVPSSWFLHVFSQISPAAAVVGGVLAQEVIKVISGREEPISNIFLFDPESCCGFIEHIAADFYHNK